jgi:hypothetical protein
MPKAGLVHDGKRERSPEAKKDKTKEKKGKRDKEHDGKRERSPEAKKDKKKEKKGKRDKEHKKKDKKRTRSASSSDDEWGLPPTLDYWVRIRLPPRHPVITVVLYCRTVLARERRRCALLTALNSRPRKSAIVHQSFPEWRSSLQSP